MALVNRRILLASRPNGWPTADNFQFEEVPAREPDEDEILVEVHYLSVDPYMRGRMRDAPSYAEPVQIGEVMTGAGVGKVLVSRNSKFAPGDFVQGVTGWQSHCTGAARGFGKVDPSRAPIPAALGVLGAPGLTAYFGVLDVGKVREGETLLVSGGAGAVGSVAGQIGKIIGCRVAGIAGSDDKVRWMVDDLGFDAGFNYKTRTNYREAIEDLCPNGVDVYFDNVGGPITDAVFGRLNRRGRVVVCGQISQYNSEQTEMGPRFLHHLIVKRARVEGFLVMDYASQFREARAQLTEWLAAGKIRHREQIVEGIENTPAAFLAMMRGENTGKMLVKLI